MLSRTTLLRIPYYSESSVAIAYSLLEQQNAREGRALKTFIPAFDFAEQMSKPAKIIIPKKYVHIDLTVLQDSLPQKELVETIRNAKLNVEDRGYTVKIKKVFQKCVGILNKVLPSRIVKSKLISSVHTRIMHYFNIIGILLTPMEVGPNRVALLSRARELAEKKEEYENRIGNYAALLVAQSQSSNLDSCEKENIEKEKEYLDGKKISIDLDERMLRMDYFKYLVEISKYILSNLALIISFSPFKSLIDLAAIVQRLPGIIELMDFGLSYLSLGQMKEKVNIFNDWENRYREWENRCISMQKKNISHESQFSAIKQDRQIYKDFNWQDLKNYFQDIKFDENEKWDHFIESSNSLCEKRLAIREKR